MQYSLWPPGNGFILDGNSQKVDRCRFFWPQQAHLQLATMSCSWLSTWFCFYEKPVCITPPLLSRHWACLFLCDLLVVIRQGGGVNIQCCYNRISHVLWCMGVLCPSKLWESGMSNFCFIMIKMEPVMTCLHFASLRYLSRHAACATFFSVKSGTFAQLNIDLVPASIPPFLLRAMRERKQRYIPTTE